jgi:hypothetical protein
MDKQGLKFFESNPPRFDNGSTFLGYKVPAGQTFTSYSPDSDNNAYLNAITGLSGYKQRNLLQSAAGTAILSQSVSGRESNAISYLGLPGFQSKASCQQDADCGNNQICYAFAGQSFGPNPGPTCSPSIYPEIALGNSFNEGKPLRQYSNYCQTSQDCKGVDQFSGKNKVGMSCNHYYKGPSMFEKTGLCQVEYESKGRRYNLKTPPGWVEPLNDPLRECKTQNDCGPSGINGWVRCVGGSDDNKKYCVWPGQTNTPTPKELQGEIPQGMRRQPLPRAIEKPSPFQQNMLNERAEAANSPGLQTPGGGLGNTRGPPTPVRNLVAGPEPTNIGGFK